MRILTCALFALAIGATATAHAADRTGIGDMRLKSGSGAIAARTGISPVERNARIGDALATPTPTRLASSQVTPHNSHGFDPYYRDPAPPAAATRAADPSALAIAISIA